MKKTLEIMMEELRLAKKEKEPLSKAIYVVNEKISKLENETIQARMSEDNTLIVDLVVLEFYYKKIN